MSHEYGALVSTLRETLTRQRYNPVVVQNYCRNADYFLTHLAEREIAIEMVTPTIVSDYLRLAVQQFRKRHRRAPARYWMSIPQIRNPRAAEARAEALAARTCGRRRWRAL